MNWTNQLPTATGYYWWRRYRYKAPVLFRVFPSLDRRICRRIDLNIPCDIQIVAELGGDWYGPITIPYPEDDTAPVVP